MAAMALQTPPGSEPERLPMPSRNPLPLSASQEAQVRDIFYARVRSHCGDEIKGLCSLALPPGAS
jgi:COX assembly protein 1